MITLIKAAQSGKFTHQNNGYDNGRKATKHLKGDKNGVMLIKAAYNPVHTSTLSRTS